MRLAAPIVALLVGLAVAPLAADARDEAKKQVFEALLIAPTYTRAQDLLLKLQEGSR